MITEFLKMHGAGNDFIVVDARAGALDLSNTQVAALSDRRRGIGCDQFIILEPPPPGADVFMRIRNADGSEAGACGNATRCIADLLMRETGRDQVVVRTISGDLPAHRQSDGQICVDMGPPALGWQALHLAHEADTLHLPLGGDPAGVSMGNPHANFFVEALDATDVAALGAAAETDPLFTEGANIGFVQIESRDRMRLRVWERGVGLTLACGSGACAALVNAHRRGLVGRAASVVMDGGVLQVQWRPDGHVLMAGPVASVFRGRICS